MTTVGANPAILGAEMASDHCRRNRGQSNEAAKVHSHPWIEVPGGADIPEVVVDLLVKELPPRRRWLAGQGDGQHCQGQDDHGDDRPNPLGSFQEHEGNRHH